MRIITIAEAERVQCPECGADPGAPCRWASYMPHMSRAVAAGLTEGDE